MKSKYLVKFIHFIGILIMLGGPLAAQSIKVAVASNLLLPFQAIEKKFESKFPYEIDIIPAASGTLTAQIVAGAPYQVFVSADDTYIDEVISKGKAHGEPYTICYGTVYLWVKKGIEGSDPASILKSEQVKSIGLAHPDLAPYGKLARDWLEVKQLGVAVQKKIVFGTSIGQVNQYIVSGAVDAAFTSNSLKFSRKKNDGTFIKIEEMWMDTVPQTMVLINSDETGLFIATLFRDFLLSKDARKIFQDFGYELPLAK